MRNERTKRWLEVIGSMVVVAAVALAALAATPTSNIPISQMPIATEALETAWFPIIQPYPGRLTNDNFRVAASNLFTRGRTLINATNLTVNGTNVATVADLIWTNDQGRVRVRPEVVPYFYTYPSNFYGDGWFALEPVFQVLGSGTNTLDTKDSSYLMFSMTNDPAEVIVELTAGYAIGQELLLMSYTNTVFDGRFTLPANSVVSGGGLVKLNNNQDWLGANGSAMRLIWIEPDWWEQGRWTAGSTNQPGQIAINPTDGYMPYRVNATSFGDSPILRTGANSMTVSNVVAGEIEPFTFQNYSTDGSATLGLQFDLSAANGDDVQALGLRVTKQFPWSSSADSLSQVSLESTYNGVQYDHFNLGGSGIATFFVPYAVAALNPVTGQLGMQVRTPFLATSTVGQNSPAVIWAASGWDNSASSARSVTFGAYVEPYEDVAAPRGIFKLHTYTPSGIDQVVFSVDANSGYDGSTTKYLDASGHYSVPGGGGGGSDNWVALGTTNSTLPGVGSSYALSATNGVYSGVVMPPWWTPSADDTFISVHDVASGASDYSFFYLGNVDDGTSETNYADLTVTLKTSSLDPAAILNMATVATNDVSTFTVNLQPAQGVANIELFDRGNTAFKVSDNSGYGSSGTKYLGDDGTYKQGFAAPSVYTNVFATNLTASTDHDIYTIPTGYRGVPVFMVSTTNTSGTTTTSFKVKISGTYYVLTSGSNATTNISNIASTTFVYEPGDIVAVSCSLDGLNVGVGMALIPDTSPLKSERLTTFVVGDNTLYTVPSNKVSVGADRANLLTASAVAPAGLIYQNSGGNLQYRAYINTVKLADKDLAAGGAPLVLAVVPLMAAGDSFIINSASTHASQFAWITVYEIDQ